MEATFSETLSAKRSFYGHRREPEPNLLLKRLLWFYVWLLIVEGAFRKWFLPQYAAPLLIVRDPLVLLIYFLAHRDGVFRQSPFLHILSLLAVASLFLLVVQGLLLKVPAAVLVYGFRTNFLHLPLIFLIPALWGEQDLKRLSKWMLLTAIPMALLMAYQFRSPPDAWINRTPGLAGGSQLLAALGKIRPPGTFSFITGPVSFFTLVTAFVLYGLKAREANSSRLLLFAGGLAATLAVSVSGSRAITISVGIVLVAWLLGLMAAKQVEGGVWRMIILIALTSAVMAQSELFQEGTEVLSTRWGFAHEAERAEGGLLGRVLRTLIVPISILPSIPLFGSGLGVGTNVGATLLTGQAQFLLSEGEWGRVVLEMGPVLGSAFILFRVGLAIWLLRQSIRCATAGNLLPLLLFSACAANLVTGQIAQPTTLGFTALGTGLCLAAIQATGLPETTTKRGRTKMRSIKKGAGRLTEPSQVPSARTQGEQA